MGTMDPFRQKIEHTLRSFLGLKSQTYTNILGMMDTLETWKIKVVELILALLNQNMSRMMKYSGNRVDYFSSFFLLLHHAIKGLMEESVLAQTPPTMWYLEQT